MPTETFILTAKDRTARAFRSARRRLNKLGSAITLTRLAVVGLAGAAGFGLLIRNSFKTGDALAKTADKMGLTTEALAGLQHAAELTGVAQKTLEKSLTKMQKAIFDADRGLLTYSQHFDTLKLSTEEVMKLSPEKQFAVIGDALNKVENQTLKTAIAYDIFGGRGTALLNTLKLGSEGLAEAAKEAEILGIALSRADAAKIEESNDAITRMMAAIKGVANTIAVELAPFIKFISDSFVKSSIEANGFRDTVLDGVSSIVKGVAFIGDVFRGLDLVWEALKTTFMGFIAFVTGAWAELDRVITDTINAIPGMTAEVNQDLQDLAEATAAVLEEQFEKTKALLEEPLPSQGIEEFMEGLRTQAIIRTDMRAEEIAADQKHQSTLTKIEKEGAKARAKFDKLTAKNKTKQVFGQLASITQGVADHNKTLFNINKIAGIANATIATYEGVSMSLKAYPMPLAGIMAAVHLAAGLAQISAIKSTSFGGGGGASGTSTGGGGGSVSAPTAVAGFSNVQTTTPEVPQQQVIKTTVNLDGQPIIEAVQMASQDGRLEIDANAVR